MYAVFEHGSHQYRVSEGDVVTIDRRQEAKPGDQVELENILLYVNGDDCQTGQPLLEGAKVVAEVVDHVSKKYIIQKFRRRKNSRRLKGHRQWWTRIKIKHILLAGQSAPAEEKKAEEPKAEPESKPEASAEEAPKEEASSTEE